MTVIKTKQHATTLQSVKPRGWLRDQLMLQLEGITLHLDENWGSVGPFSDWIGGSDNSWERPPYWLDGLVPLVYMLEHEEGIKKARRWMVWSLESQRENGDFGPVYRKTEFDDTLFWPKFVMLKAMISYYEAEHDERIPQFMLRYFSFCNKLLDTYKMDGWAQARAGDFAYTIYWLYELTEEEFLLELVDKVNRQSLNWTEYFENLPFTRETGYYYDWQLMDENVSRWHLYDVMKYHATHIVNVTMGLKQPLMEYKRTGNRRYLDAIYTGLHSLQKYHGQVTGIFSGDEHLHGRKPTQGSELCSVVELMFSLQLIYDVSKDTRFLDLLERIAYNALPATISEDFKAHQYDQQANQVLVTQAKRDWYNNGDRANLFGFEPNFGCCLANMHQGWPKFTGNAIFLDQDTVIAGVYMPMQAEINVKDCRVSIIEETMYPFHSDINFCIHSEKPVSFPMQLRIPSWCKHPEVTIQNECVPIQTEQGCCRIHLDVNKDLNIRLRLPMEVTLHTGWYHNGLSIERGPVIYALNIEEEWKKLAHGKPEYPDYEIYPKSPWNYAIDTKEEIRVAVSERKTKQVFSKEHPPVRLFAKGFLLPQWKLEQNSAQDLPQSPVIQTCDSREIELIPYGCAKLRISLFPWK